MSSILMPIKPQFVEKILSGNKKYEYRKIKAKKNNTNKMIIYATSPVMKVVAEVSIEEVLEDFPEKIWEKTKDYSGTTKEFYDKYFINSKKAVAYKIGKIKVYDKPKKLSELGINYTPQSFIYLDKKIDD